MFSRLFIVLWFTLALLFLTLLIALHPLDASRFFGICAFCAFCASVLCAAQFIFFGFLNPARLFDRDR